MVTIKIGSSCMQGKCSCPLTLSSLSFPAVLRGHSWLCTPDGALGNYKGYWGANLGQQHEGQHLSCCPAHPLLLFLCAYPPGMKVLTCQDAGGCRDTKETSRGQEQWTHIGADFFWVTGSEAAVQGHLRYTHRLNPSGWSRGWVSLTW